jgi:hypothetical protein
MTVGTKCVEPNGDKPSRNTAPRPDVTSFDLHQKESTQVDMPLQNPRSLKLGTNKVSKNLPNRPKIPMAGRGDMKHIAYSGADKY